MANMEIVDLCLKLSESLLIKINQKRVYEEFEYQFDSVSQKLIITAIQWLQGELPKDSQKHFSH